MLVKFVSLKSENFLSIDKIELDFKSGITSIVGVNATDSFSESNGSGKSSIVESLIWCLSGSTTRGISSDAVINNKRIENGCSVESIIELDGDVYKVTRTRGGSRGNSLSIMKNSEDISGNTMKKSQQILEELIPLTYEDLTSCIILAQDMPNRLSNLSPSGRKSKLEKIANYDDKVDNIKSKISSKQKAVQSEIKEVSIIISQKSGSLLSEMNKTLERMKSDLKNHEDELSRVESENEEILKYNSELESKHQLTKDKMEKCKVKIDEVNVCLEELDKGKGTLDKDILNTKLLVSEHQSSVKFINSQIESKRKEISNLSGGVCITCGRPLDNQDEILNISKKLSDEIEEKLSDLKDAHNSLGISNSYLTDLQKSMDSVLEKKKSLESSKRDYESEYHRLMQDELRQSTPKAIKTVVDNREKMKSDIISKEEEIKAVESEIETLQNRGKELEEKNSRLSTILSDISRGSFRNFLLEKTMMNFNYLLSQISIELMKDEPVKLQFDGNKIEIMYNNKYYEQMSGGEKKRIDIAVELTVRKYKSLVSGINFDLLVMDETFDSLDKKGIDNLFNAVEASGTTDKFFVISHREDACLNYDQKIVICKKDGFSTIIN